MLFRISSLHICVATVPSPLATSPPAVWPPPTEEAKGSTIVARETMHHFDHSSRRRELWSPDRRTIAPSREEDVEAPVTVQLAEERLGSRRGRKGELALTFRRALCTESSATLIRARDVVDAGELAMSSTPVSSWLLARAPGSPPNLTAPRTTHAALRPGSRRRWPPRSSAVGHAYVRLCRSYPPPWIRPPRQRRPDCELRSPSPPFFRSEQVASPCSFLRRTSHRKPRPPLASVPSCHCVIASPAAVKFINSVHCREPMPKIELDIPNPELPPPNHSDGKQLAN
ncbi:hypothetical protein TIFTF001_048819 [Ficus carica]|uniref:Uncharacterized protein n=1 Tax=Ficus carica TaxID=3494 RepID=A0AA87YZJ5_FICCA|nr:hypothetical protein TIFTF001_048812 [Ficus carica]GMN20913.1 hypothetical protein TIFTF001_048813 [Ficus carica]GMN20920.1 hypothetical protein TIFTF001_048814 [Ficus carica]GMN20927.1 hypothetical protein TIFTF001_048815 [Ficus carica]GMN20932.1 hypothetical protein TIFTF001_048816 [Ficus carica]